MWESIKKGWKRMLRALVIALSINLLLGFAYCYFAKAIDIVTYSNTLSIIGGAYLAFGGLAFMGGMSSQGNYTYNFNGTAKQSYEDKLSRGRFDVMVLLIGMVTMLAAFAVLVFQ